MSIAEEIQRANFLSVADAQARAVANQARNEAIDEMNAARSKRGFWGEVGAFLNGSDRMDLFVVDAAYQSAYARVYKALVDA